MPRPKKRRSYDGSGRAAAAALTRESILSAAHALFLAHGYVATTMPAIAKKAEVALDTVYATVGAKPALFRALVERAISGAEGPLPPEEREYVRAIRAAATAREKLTIYAGALGAIQPRLAPLIRVLQQAAHADRELQVLWDEISRRRAANMRLFVDDLARTGELRSDLPKSMIADILWSMNAPEFYMLLVHERGWPVPRFCGWLAEAWERLLVEPPRGDRPARSVE